jgi:hypothetical protein
VPSGPQRHLFLFGVLIVSLGAGLALTFLLNQLHPVFFTGRAVTAVSGLPVLGTVSLFLSQKEWRTKRRSRRQFVLVLTVFLAFFIATMSTVEIVSPLLRDLSGMDS